MLERNVLIGRSMNRTQQTNDRNLEDTMKTTVDKRKWNAGFDTANANVAKKGLAYAERNGPRDGDDPDWAMGYLTALAAIRDRYN